MTGSTPPVPLDDLLQAEWTAIDAERAERRRDDRWFQEPGNRFGIALSGGGIRAATIAYGFLEVLNRFTLLSQADYLSTVSGGGFTGGYIHLRLSERRDAPDPYATLFSKEDQDWFQSNGKYLTPGTGARQLFSDLKLASALLASLLLNWTWMAALAGFLYFLLAGLWQAVGWDRVALSQRWLVVVSLVVLSWHLLFHWLRHTRPVALWSSDFLNRLEAWLLAALVVYATSLTGGAAVESPVTSLTRAGGSLLALAALGFLVNPNLLTMHRFYRDRLARAYLRAVAERRLHVRLHQLSARAGKWRRAPYPLINACVNLLGGSDPRFKGTRTSDYFLLSPLYCGSKLTGYRPTRDRSFRGMTLATAVACSGAAVNPEMGWRSSTALALLMSLLNLRLGYWARNPRFEPTDWLTRAPWWPAYQLLEVFSLTDSNRRLVNISDGGHIENLGVYELLRRRCRLIVALDASGDPHYGFDDLRNLVIRARQELGVTITFRQPPEEFIRPASSNGFSRSQFVLADIGTLSGAPQGPDAYSGLLVYIKSSLRAQQRWKQLDSESFAYKTYHPTFPHESTANQFFDPVQWKAYYSLGRFIAGDLLREDCTDRTAGGARRVAELFDRLAALRDGRGLEEYLASPLERKHGV